MQMQVSRTDIKVNGRRCVMKTTPAIKVTFKETGHTDYFGSVAAIYECYTRDDLGITLRSLWQRPLPYQNKRVWIQRIEIKHKPQQNKQQ